MHVFIKGIWKNLADGQSGDPTQIFNHQMVPLIGDRMGVLGKISVGDGILRPVNRDLFPLG